MTVVLVADEQADHPVDTGRWERLALGVLRAEGVVESTELSMTFLDEPAMAELNRCFAGEEGPTDVLAFPMDDDVVAGPGGPPAVLGDVVICPAVAARSAPHHAGTYDDELALLVVHGILHLMGMDHQEAEAARAMRRREQQLLDRLHRSTAPHCQS